MAPPPESRLSDVLSNDLFRGEKARGAGVAVLNGLLSNGLNYAGTAFLGLNPVLSAVIFVYATGSLTGYMLDIMLAKRAFKKGPGTTAEVALPYGPAGWAPRARWLARSFVSKNFIRFLVVVLIEALVAGALLDAALNAARRAGWIADSGGDSGSGGGGGGDEQLQLLTQQPQDQQQQLKASLTNVAFTLGVSIFVFFLFGNVLRFDWAYRDAEIPIMNITVITLATLTVLAYSLTYTARSA